MTVVKKKSMIVRLKSFSQQKFKATISMINKLIQSDHVLKWLLLFHFCIWMIVSLILDIQPDMADHWVWSRRLDWGYNEHPPMVAWMMRLVTTILPIHPVYALKIGAVLVSTLILSLAYKVGVSFFNKETAVLYLLILEGTPYFSMGSVFWHIDQFYMVFWLLGLLSFSRYLQTKNLNYILLFGVFAGFGAVSKYITLLFYFSLFFWCIFDQRFRPLFLKWQTYAAGLISFLVFSPVFIWNAVNDWTSFRFQFKKGVGGSEAILGKLLELTIGHLFVFSLIFTVIVWFLLISGKLISRPVSEKYSFLLAAGLVPLLFFSLSSLRGTIAEAHWLNTSYFSIFLLLANYLIEKRQTIKPLWINTSFISAYLLNYLILAIILLQVLFRMIPLPIVVDAATKLVAWDHSAKQIDLILEQHQNYEPEYVISREYQLSGSLSLYMATHPLSHSLEKPERNKWSPDEAVKSSQYILVCVPKDCQKARNKIFKKFGKEMKPLEDIETRLNGYPVRQLSVYVPN